MRAYAYGAIGVGGGARGGGGVPLALCSFSWIILLLLNNKDIITGFKRRLTARYIYIYVYLERAVCAPGVLLCSCGVKCK